MLTRRRSRSRRSGISSIIGAIFFVLVVFLVFSSTVLVFESFSNYSLLFKGVNQQDAQNKATQVNLANLAFGGVLPSASGTESLITQANNVVPARSLLPVANMNFSDNMNGWTFARQYKIVRDDGYVTNTFLNVLPGASVFTLRVSNADPAGTCPNTSCIVRVVLQVDSRFGLGGLPVPTPPAGWGAPLISGNTITWLATPGNGLPPPPGSNTALFNWTASAPGVPGSYFHTVTLTWSTVFHGVQISDEGFATIQTEVVTGGPGDVSIPTLCPPPATWNICAEPAGVIPGGAVGGYDAVSTGIGSESGPGSLDLNFQPTYNGTTITGGQQLTAVMNYTTAFTIDKGQAGSLAIAGNPDTLNFGYSLDQVVAPPNPLILIKAYLVQLTNVNTIKAIVQIPNLNPVVPTQVNNFNPSGWVTCNPSSTSCPMPSFNPATLAAAQGQPAWVWTPGLYELIISVSASMPGANPPSSDYPSSVLMHFDDIGLALQDTANGFFVDNAGAAQTCTNPSPPPATVPCGLLKIPMALDPSQLQSIQLTTNIALSSAPVNPSQNVTAYIFLGDVSRGTATPVWVEVGQLELSSSATVTVSIPASSASAYIDKSGNTCGGVGFCVRIYAISDGNNGGVAYNFGSLSASASIALQTWQQNVVTVTINNNSTFPVGFSTVYISGPDGVSSFQLAPNLVGPYYCAGSALVPPGSVTPCYINQGQGFIVQLPFVWKTDQTYVATVVTNKGLTFSQTFLSP